MTQKRLFVALDLPQALAPAIHALAADTRSRCAALLREQPRFVDAARMHLTLKFLGNVDEERVGGLAELVRGIAARHAPIAAEDPTLDAFPRPARAHVLVVSFADPVRAFAALSADLEGALAALGFARDERPFRPHVTLARMKHATDVRAITREPIALSAGAFDRIVLYESTLGAAPHYTAITRHPLMR